MGVSNECLGRKERESGAREREGQATNVWKEGEKERRGLGNVEGEEKMKKACS